MKKLILSVALLGASFAAVSAPPVITGVSTNGVYAFKAYGQDLVLYKNGKMIERCVSDDVNRGIDNQGSPYVLDIYSCSNGTKSFGVKTMQEEFLISVGGGTL
ncbi:hypothetical protein Marshall_90 [Salmonella phage Marshall]|uniref:Uncharacterized protein n=1 Tax=Salmonella phage Marshall TaxID=1406794 RepID=U5PYF1_9CAUD|nr:hypothetical protein Marshall_90 [Salmonella phage Marshall]AGY47607.1 hypothetical protein Marshall_90 [Salmonella phage Marshall]